MSILLLHLVAAGLLWRLGRRWLEEHLEDRPVWRAMGAFAAVVLGLAALVDPGLVPIEVVNVLHEGSTEQLLQHLAGTGVHAGPVFKDFLVPLAARRGVAPLLGLVRFDLALAIVNAALFFAIARRVAGRAGAAALAATLLLGPNALAAATSELPSTAIATYLLLSAIPAASIRPGAPWRTQVEPFAGLALLTGLVAGCRTEMAGVGLWWMAFALGRRAVGDDRLEAMGARLRAAVGARMGWPRPERALLGVALTVLSVRRGLLPLLAWSWGPNWGTRYRPLPAIPPLPELGDLVWALRALHPLDPSTLTLPPLTLAMMPMGATLAALVGVSWSVRHPVKSALLMVPVLYLYRVYHVAGHESLYEVYRYVSMLQVPVLAVSAFGLGALGDRPRLLVLLTFLVPPLPSLAWTAAELVVPHDLPATLPRLGGRLDRDPQRALRVLEPVLRQHPDCLVATRSLQWNNDGASAAPVGTDWVFARGIFGFGPQHHRVVPVVDPTDMRAALAEALAPLPGEDPPPCVLFFRGLDCTLEGEDDCASLWGAGTPLVERTWTSAPYVDDSHGRVVRPEVTVGVYAIEASARAVGHRDP